MNREASAPQRSELDEARRQIDALERELGAQQKMTAQLRRRIAGADGGGTSRRRIAASALAVAAAVATTWWLTRGTESDPALMSSGREPPASASEPRRAKPRRPPAGDKGSRDASEAQRSRPSVPGEDEIVQLQARCARTVPRGTLDELPQGTRVLDFEKCFGCDCCLEGNAFPPLFGPDHRVIEAAGECMECSKQATLADAGIAISGGSHGDPLAGGRGLALALDRPPRVFALAIQGGGYTIGRKVADGVVVLVAYDGGGRAIDAARVVYPLYRDKDDPRRDFEDQKQVLLVQACEGETIARLELATTDMNVRVTAIAR